MGELKISYLENENTYKIRIKLRKSAMTRRSSFNSDTIAYVASAGDQCSLQITEYGDMRSFLAKTAQPGSHGTPLEIAPAFECLDSLNDSAFTNIVKLMYTGVMSVQNFRTILGKGLLLQNLDKNVTIGFGVITTEGLPFSHPYPRELTAVCQDSTSLSMLLYSNLEQSTQTLFAYYQPLANELVTSIDKTSVNVQIEGFKSEFVKSIEKTYTSGCSKFSFINSDSVNPFTNFAIGKTVKVYLS